MMVRNCRYAAETAFLSMLLPVVPDRFFMRAYAKKAVGGRFSVIPSYAERLPVAGFLYDGLSYMTLVNL